MSQHRGAAYTPRRLDDPDQGTIVSSCLTCIRRKEETSVAKTPIATDVLKGVLTIAIPKTAKAVEQRKKIEVKSAA
jgi:hypothetical protein